MGLLHWLGGGVIAGTISGWAGALIIPLAWLTTYRRRWLAVLVCLSGIVAGQWRSHIFIQQLDNKHWYGTINQAAALVCAPADTRDGFTYLTLCLKNPNTTVRATYTGRDSFELGDWVQLSGTITKPQIAASTFDYAAYLERYLVFGVMKRPTITSSPSPPAKTPLHVWWRQLTIARRQVETAVNQLLPDPEASFLAGLLLGSKRAIPTNVMSDLQRTGTTHIIAVSGANVVIVASFILIAARFTLGQPRAAWWLSQIVIWGFVILTGISAAAVRGATVASFSLWASHARRHTPPATILLIPATISLLINPLIAQDIGWQLSYAAFFGLTILAKPTHLICEKIYPKTPKVISETIAATTATAPFCWYHFGTVSLSSLIVNPIVLALVPVATFAGAGMVLIHRLFPPLWLLPRLIALIPLRLSLAIIHLGAKIPLTWSSA